LWPGRVGSDEWQVDFRLHRRGEFDLGLFSGLLQTLERHFVFGKIYALILLELIVNPLDQALIYVVTAQMRITIGRFHLDHAFADFKDRNVEGAAAKVENRDSLVFLLVETIGQRRCRRLIDDTQYL